MIFLMRLMVLMTAMTIFLQFGCKDSVKGPTTAEWEFLGFEDKFAVRLVLAEPYLYVCAGSDGLWKRNIREMTSWECLGFVDTSLGKYFNVGVVDVDVKGNDIIISYNPVHVESWISTGIWRSTDGGRTWLRSDNGIPDSSWPYSVYGNVQRAPHNPNIAVTSSGGAVFRSTDGGSTWVLIAGQRGGMANRDLVKWQFNREGVVWFFGESAIFSPYLDYSEDYGLTFTSGVLPRVPVDNAVYDIGFDATAPYTLYVGMQGAMIKTTNGGRSWIVPMFTHPEGAFIRSIVAHPRIQGFLYFAAGRTLYYSINGGNTVYSIQSPNHTQILSMIYDEYDDSLIMGTETGIFRYRTHNNN